MRCTALALSLLVLSCGSKKAPKEETVCDKYAAMESTCGEVKDDENGSVKKIAKQFCERSLGGNNIAEIGDEIECAKVHEDCASYRKCAGLDVE